MKRWMLVSFCGECREPIPFSPCSFLGYNPGVDGHLFKSKETAQQALEATAEAIKKFGYQIETETTKEYYLLEGPSLPDGGFWQHTIGLKHITTTDAHPCIILHKCGFIIHDVNMVSDVRPIEIQLFL